MRFVLHTTVVFRDGILLFICLSSFAKMLQVLNIPNQYNIFTSDRGYRYFSVEYQPIRISI